MLKKIHPHILNLKHKLFSTKQRAIISICIFLIIGGGTAYLYDHFAKGATYGWLQSSWSGNVDISTRATHADNQTGWTKFFSKKNNISADNQITLSSTNSTILNTETSDFQTGTNTNGTYPIINSSDELKLDIPTCEIPVTTANAGIDQVNAATCGLTTVTLNGNAPVVGTGSWSVVSGENGTFDNVNLRNTTFSGTAGTTYVLRWTISNGSCPVSIDDVSVKFNINPTIANAGSDQSVSGSCWTDVVLAANNPTIGTGYWSIVSGNVSGNVFTNSSLYNTTFKASNPRVYVLRWTISNGVCASTDNMNLTTTLQADCGSTVTDIDGNVYNVLTINGKCWMKENLKTTKYNTGGSIPYVTDGVAWGTAGAAYSWYNNDYATYGSVYGAIYSGHAVKTNSICPVCWSVPSESDFEAMFSYYISAGYNYDDTITGNKLAKSMSMPNNYWTASTGVGAPGNSDYPDKMNVTGFSGLPGGCRRSISGVYSFDGGGSYGRWWTTTQGSNFTSLTIRAIYNSSYSSGQDTYWTLPSGMSVRCIRNF
ncbi:MAG: FISUMP domain-containing protein [Candidatus Moraniibacteriota bacterium]